MNIPNQIAFIRSIGSRALSLSRFKSKDKDDNHELHKVIENSHEILAKADTVFPLTLFPDTVTIDRTKINIVKRNFFKVSQTTSIRIEDILNVMAMTGPFFGTIKITSRVFNNQKPTEVNFLWRDDASNIKCIAQGYVIALQKEIDCSNLAKEELIDLLTKLGHEDPQM